MFNPGISDKLPKRSLRASSVKLAVQEEMLTTFCSPASQYCIIAMYFKGPVKFLALAVSSSAFVVEIFVAHINGDNKGR